MSSILYIIGPITTIHGAGGLHNIRGDSMDEIKLENRLTRLEENVDVMGEEIVDLQENQE